MGENSPYDLSRGMAARMIERRKLAEQFVRDSRRHDDQPDSSPYDLFGMYKRRVNGQIRQAVYVDERMK